MPAEPTILCPIKGPLPAPTCPPEELEPLLDALRANRRVAAPRTFPRGTLLPDGRLDLCKQGLGLDGCRAVTAALAGNTVVRSLLLGTNGIGDAGAAAVAELLSVNRTLEVVYLGCNGIGEAGTRCLVKGVAGNPGVAGLWLKRNPIGTGGARAVAELIRSGSGVRTLDLVNTMPGAAALGEVFAALTDAPTAVEALYLGGNGLDASAGPALAALVAGNRTLRGLFLNVNRLGDEGVGELSDGLARNRTLIALGLASNGFGAAGAAALARGLRGHPNLACLDLGYSPSTRVLGCAANRLDGGADALADLIAGCPRLAELGLAKTGTGPAALEQLAGAIEQNPAVMSVPYSGPRVPALDDLLDARRARCGWTPPPRPDVALIRSVYR